MDLYSTLSAAFSEQDLETNLIASNGEDKSFTALYESFTAYTHASNELLDVLEEFDNVSVSDSFLCMENWESGIEGVLGDIWFKFVQFIKKIVAHMRVTWNHFINGNSRQKRYFEQVQVNLKSGIKSANWGALMDTSGMLYTVYEFEDLLKICTKLEAVLTSIYRKNDFELDSVMDFDQYGITFKDNRIVNRNIKTNDEYMPTGQRFEIVFTKKATSFKQAGWNNTSFSGLLSKLIDRLEFNIKKDYQFIYFQNSMESLIRKGGSDGKNYDAEQVIRLTHSVKSVVSMTRFMTNTINDLSKQMLLGCRALEKPIDGARSSTVY